MKKIKCVLVGDEGVGKTSILFSYINKTFKEDFFASVYGTVDFVVKVGKEKVNLSLWDTASREEYEQLRPLAYSQTDIFIICFSLVDLYSFENVKIKWIPEIRHHCPKTPFIIVGNKIDLCDDKNELEKLELKNQKSISYIEGLKISKEIGAVRYFVCSAKIQVTLEEVFESAVRNAMRNKKIFMRESQCELL